MTKCLHEGVFPDSYCCLEQDHYGPCLSRPFNVAICEHKLPEGLTRGICVKCGGKAKKRIAA